MSASAELLVLGRIATLGGPSGFGWTSALAIADGRVVATGAPAGLEGLVGPRTARLELAPGEVAIPGLTDAHLHLVEAALAAERVDLTGAASLADGLGAIAAAHERLPAGAWLEGYGWDAERWAAWPTAADLTRIAPGRAAVLWAHDHHAVWVSGPALEVAGIGAGTSDPAGGVIGRGRDGVPTGILHEEAVGLVVDHLPGASPERVRAAVETLVPSLVAAGIVAVHDPGVFAPDPDLVVAIPAYVALDEAGRLGLRVHASLQEGSLEMAERRGLRSGAPLGGGDRVRLGWLKLFADGTLGSRTAALLRPYEPEAGRPAPPGGETGMDLMAGERLAELARRAATAGIGTQIHAIGDRAVRSALAALEPSVGLTGVIPRVEHAQLVDPADLVRFGRAGIAASVQPVHLRSDGPAARRAWGTRAERSGYAWRSLVDGGALLPFGTDAPVEPWDPWPGIELAVTRRAPAWEPREAFGPDEALGLDRALRAACLDPARVAGEADRGRLVPGARADLVVLQAEALSEPVEAGGPLGRVRPRLVVVDGRIAAGSA